MKALALLALFAGMLLGPPAHAQSLSTLATSPISKFNAADNKLFMAAINKSLAQGVEGTTISWANDKSPASGSVTPQKSREVKGMPCRDLLIANSYKTLKAEAVHTFCRNAAGNWKLLA